MKRVALHLTRGLLLALSLGFFGALVLSAIPMLVQAQDAPAPDCFSGPNVICPALEDPSAEYIGSVTAAPDGVIILLTDAGIDHARACGGPAEIAAMAAALYDAIPLEQRSDFQLDWESQALQDEIYGHAFFSRLSGGLAGLGSIHERANPINVDFADYGGPGQMTIDARAEQTTFAALGAVHRAGC